MSAEGSHAWARPIVARALAALLGRSADEGELQLVRAVGWLETRYGRGWSRPELLAAHNWGAVQSSSRNADGSCPSGCVPGSDTDPDRGGAAYRTCFRAYASDDAGAADMARQILSRKAAPTRRGPSVRDALASSSADELAAAMWIGGYFEGQGPTARGRVEGYAAAIYSAALKASTTEGVPCAVVRAPLDASAVSFRRRRGEATKPAKGWDAESVLSPGWLDFDGRPIGSAAPASGNADGGALALLVALAFFASHFVLVT